MKKVFFSIVILLLAIFILTGCETKNDDNGKHRIGCNMAVQLKAICIITRSLYNHIEEITKQQAYTMLVQQVFHPTDTKKMKKTLDLIDIMADKIKFYKLGCNMDISAAKTSYEGMR